MEARPLKISFILSSLWLSGGILDILENANSLVDRGHQVTFVIPGQTYDPDVGNGLRQAIEVRQTRTAGAGPKRTVSLLDMGRLTWELAQLTPPSDLIISTQTPTTAAGFLAGRLFKRGRLVWYYQDYLEMFINRPLETWLLKNAMRWHEKALVLSQSSKDELHRYSSKPVIVVGNGLSNSEYFKPLPSIERPSNPDRYNILFLGDMRPRKGLYDFLAAMEIVHRQIPKVHLWIISKEDCNIHSELSFEYIYRPPRSDLARLYATCDVFVSASWWESFGIPPLEAMACGAPVVMTDSRGGRDYAHPGENCLMVPPQNPQALANAIIQVLTDPILSERMRANGPTTAAEFTWDKINARFESALLDLFSAPKPIPANAG